MTTDSLEECPSCRRGFLDGTAAATYLGVSPANVTQCVKEFAKVPKAARDAYATGALRADRIGDETDLNPTGYCHDP